MSSSTSIGALISIIHIRGKLNRRVWNALKAYGKDGATCDELEHALSLRHQTLSARVRELYLGGWIRKTGVKRTGSGRLATTYCVRKRRKKRKPRDRCPRCGQVVVVK